MNNLLCIVGPTAVGKTKLAMDIKQNLEKKSTNSGRTELISIDSRQVYIGMDIGTNKDEKIFGTDLAKPNRLFNVSDFAKIIRAKIQDLWKQNVLPILVGGTGFYLKAVVDGIETMNIPPNKKLRKKLEKYSLKELQKELKRMDFRLHGANSETRIINNSDWNNPRRLIRKIEIMKFNEKSQAAFLQKANLLQENNLQKNGRTLQIDKLVFVGLSVPLSKIKIKIEKRAQERLNMGLLNEIEALVKQYGWNEVLKNTIGYREWEDFFKGKTTKEQAISKWIKDEINFAKRQITWFKKDSRIVWLKKNYLEQSLEIVNSSFF